MAKVQHLSSLELLHCNCLTRRTPSSPSTNLYHLHEPRRDCIALCDRDLQHGECLVRHTSGVILVHQPRRDEGSEAHTEHSHEREQGFAVLGDQPPLPLMPALRPGQRPEPITPQPPEMAEEKAGKCPLS